jgi:hypothetical protein
MHQKHLLRFIKKKLKQEKDTVVIFRDGRDLTLSEVKNVCCIEIYFTSFSLSRKGTLS